MIPMTGETVNTTQILQGSDGSFVRFEFELEDGQQTSDLLSLCIDEEESYFLIVHPATGKHQSTRKHIHRRIVNEGMSE